MLASLHCHYGCLELRDTHGIPLLATRPLQLSPPPDIPHPGEHQPVQETGGNILKWFWIKNFRITRCFRLKTPFSFRVLCSLIKQNMSYSPLQPASCGMLARRDFGGYFLSFIFGPRLQPAPLMRCNVQWFWLGPNLEFLTNWMIEF